MLVCTPVLDKQSCLEMLQIAAGVVFTALGMQMNSDALQAAGMRDQLSRRCRDGEGGDGAINTASMKVSVKAEAICRLGCIEFWWPGTALSQ